MKIVSIEVAKAIKEAGYPQGTENTSYYNKNGVLIEPFVFDGDYEIADAPTYIEVWLWLWKEKGIKLSVEPNDDETECYTKDLGKLISEFGSNPEEAIVPVINYLVEKNLIK